MNLLLHVLEFTARSLLGAAAALRGFRGSPDDAHALSHLCVVQSVLDPEECNGVCTCDMIVDALERRRRAN